MLLLLVILGVVVVVVHTFCPQINKLKNIHVAMGSRLSEVKYKYSKLFIHKDQHVNMTLQLSIMQGFSISRKSNKPTIMLITCRCRQAKFQLNS